MEYGPDGTPAALIGHALDITRRKEAEEASVERDMALAATNRELEAFSYSVSHDLRPAAQHRRLQPGDCWRLYQDKLDAPRKGYLAADPRRRPRNGQLIDDLSEPVAPRHATPMRRRLSI